MRKSSHSSGDRGGKQTQEDTPNQENQCNKKTVRQHTKNSNTRRKSSIVVSKKEKENKKGKKSRTTNDKSNIRMKSIDTGPNQKFYFTELPLVQQKNMLKDEVDDLYDKVCFLRDELRYRQEQVYYQKLKMKRSEDKVIRKACLDSELSAEIVRLRFQSQELSDQEYEIKELISQRNISDLRAELFDHKTELRRLQKDSLVYNEKISQAQSLLDDYTSTEYHKQMEVIVNRYDELKQKLKEKVNEHHQLKEELAQLRKSIVIEENNKKRSQAESSNEIAQLYKHLNELKDKKDNLILKLEKQRNSFEDEIQSTSSTSPSNSKQSQKKKILNELATIDMMISSASKKKAEKKAKRAVHPPETSSINSSRRSIHSRTSNPNAPTNSYEEMNSHANPRRKKMQQLSNKTKDTETSENDEEATNYNNKDYSDKHINESEPDNNSNTNTDTPTDNSEYNKIDIKNNDSISKDDSEEDKSINVNSNEEKKLELEESNSSISTVDNNGSQTNIINSISQDKMQSLSNIIETLGDKLNDPEHHSEKEDGEDLNMNSEEITKEEGEESIIFDKKPSTDQTQLPNQPNLDSSLRRLLDSENISNSKNSTFDEAEIDKKIAEFEKESQFEKKEEDKEKESKTENENESEKENESKKSDLDSSIISQSSSAFNEDNLSNNNSTNDSIEKVDNKSEVHDDDNSENEQAINSNHNDEEEKKEDRDIDNKEENDDNFDNFDDDKSDSNNGEGETTHTLALSENESDSDSNKLLKSSASPTQDNELSTEPKSDDDQNNNLDDKSSNDDDQNNNLDDKSSNDDDQNNKLDDKSSNDDDDEPSDDMFGQLKFDGDSHNDDFW